MVTGKEGMEHQREKPNDVLEVWLPWVWVWDLGWEMMKKDEGENWELEELEK